jgi:uncharacterized protein (DUF1919 family)
MNSENIDLKDCPFCGMEQNSEDEDTLYPSGTGWKISRGFRHYVSIFDVPKEQWCYQVVCATTYGGCGAEVHGDSVEEAVAKWNRRKE